ncbi:MAG: efflux RND transporter periplasmic adaptor subunit, partial [Oscillospiraceae bacterium]|nr:efflux RND transporter periplasmic adaptor subunit [Oscillospiraceae bacterium]
MTRTKKIILAVMIVAAVAAAGLAAWYFLLPHGGNTSGGVFVQSVSSVNMADSGIANRYSGVIETQKTEKIALDSTKKVKDVLVSEGDSVKEGDPLFTYDTESINLDIQQGELEVERLNTNVTNATNQIAQLEKDMKSASSSDKLGYSAQIQELQAEIAQANYDIKSKQAEIDKLRASLDNATVTATMAGTIEKISDPDSVPSEPYYGGSEEDNAFITILAEGDYRVKGTVDEQSIYEIGVGSPVIIRSRVDADTFWTGTIASLDTQPDTNSNNGYYYGGGGESASKYPFYVELDSTDGLMLGQHVTIEMDYGQSQPKEGIWLDASFIVTDDSG